ncbi:MAG: SRPBCC domain-containing protein [Austwickia sp.]|nr:SRPBCC domain-containing protein [Austwickia sp.]MBK9102637.1 SRPBCC domain-containing protein [Austwickia sp.]
MIRKAETGRTKDAGWQVGVSRTLDHPVQRVWDMLTSPAGTDLWLGHGVRLAEEPGGPYETDEGVRGETRSFRAHDRIRLTWQPEDWDHETTVQLAVSRVDATRTRLRFHQERMTSSVEREQQRRHWRAVLDSITAALDTD